MLIGYFLELTFADSLDSRATTIESVPLKKRGKEGWLSASVNYYIDSKPSVVTFGTWLECSLKVKNRNWFSSTVASSTVDFTQKHNMDLKFARNEITNGPIKHEITSTLQPRQRFAKGESCILEILFVRERWNAQYTDLEPKDTKEAGDMPQYLDYLVNQFPGFVFLSI